jgi:hypothetical protein
MHTAQCTVYPYCQVQEQRSFHPTSALPPLPSPLPSFLVPVHCTAMKSEEFKKIKFLMIEENSHCNRKKICKVPGRKSYTAYAQSQILIVKHFLV